MNRKLYQNVVEIKIWLYFLSIPEPDFATYTVGCTLWMVATRLKYHFIVLNLW